jgi:hypothetical protein
MEQVQEIVKQIEKELNKIEPLRIAEQKTGVPKLYLAAGAAVIVALFIWLAFGVLRIPSFTLLPLSRNLNRSLEIGVD